MSIDLTIRYNEFTPGENGQSGTNTPRIGRATIPGDGSIDTPQEARDARAAALSFTREGNFQVRPQLPGQNCRPLNSEDIQDIIAGRRGAACVPVRSSQTPPVVAPRREYRLFSDSVDLVLDGSNLSPQADGRISMGQARSATAFSHESLRVYFGSQITHPYSISLVDQRYVDIVPRPPRNFSGLASVTLGGEMETAFFHFTYPLNLGGLPGAQSFQTLDLFSRSNLTLDTVEIPSTPSAQGYSFATLEFHEDANPRPVNPMVRISFLDSHSQVILQRTQSLTVSGQNTLYLPLNSPIGDQTVHLHIFDNRPSAAGERAGSTRHEMTRLQFTLPVSIPEPPLAFSNASVYIVEAEAARYGMSNGRMVNVPARRYAAISFTSSRAVEGQITIGGQTTTLSFRRGPGRYVIPIEGTEERPQVTLSAPGVAPLSLVPAALTPPVYR